MGFTVGGPDHFLGSGHPSAAEARQGKPGRLGAGVGRLNEAPWSASLGRPTYWAPGGTPR